MLKIIYLLPIFALTACQATRPTHSPSPTPIATSVANDWVSNESILPTLNPHTPTEPMTICTKNNQNPCVTAWWQRIDNPALDTFLTNVVSHNADFKLASINLQKILLSHFYDNKNGTIALTGNANIGGQYDKNTEPNYQVNRQFSMSTNANFELDFIGKLKDKKQLSEWQSIANIYEYQGVYLSLTTNAFRAYLNTKATLSKIAQNQQKSNYYNEQKKFNDVLLKTGRISELESLSLQKSILAHHQALLSLNNTYQEQLLELSLLSGQSPNTLDKLLKNDTFFEYQLPPNIAENLGVDTVDRRTDIQAAIYRLKLALNQPNLTKKNLYPSIVLTANGGVASNELISLIKLPIINWGIGINIPSLNKKEIDFQKSQDELNKQTAIIQYTDTLQKSLIEIEKSLNNYQLAHHQMIAHQKELSITKTEYEGNQKLYQLGRISYKALLESGEEVQLANHTMLESRFLAWGAWLGAMNALGLSW